MLTLAASTRAREGGGGGGGGGGAGGAKASVLKSSSTGSTLAVMFGTNPVCTPWEAWCTHILLGEQRVNYLYHLTPRSRGDGLTDVGASSVKEI